jgi:hypothetical protein
VKVVGYEARNVVASGRLDGQTIAVNAKAVAYGGNATAVGTVKTGEQLSLDLHGQAAHVDLRNLPPQVNAPGVPSNLQFAYTVKGRGPVFSGTVRMETSTLAGATIARGTTGEFAVGNGARHTRRMARSRTLIFSRWGAGSTSRRWPPIAIAAA